MRNTELYGTSCLVERSGFGTLDCFLVGNCLLTNPTAVIPLSNFEFEDVCSRPFFFSSFSLFQESHKRSTSFQKAALTVLAIEAHVIVGPFYSYTNPLRPRYETVYKGRIPIMMQFLKIKSLLTFKIYDQVIQFYQ